MTVERMLVVDLDGTLIRTDMLFESFWAALSKTWTTPFVAAACLGAGRAALKRRLRDLGAVDVATLPYNADVVGYVQRWRENEGRVALVTASDQAVAEEVASYLGIFDEVHGSDGNLNLKGQRKAQFLADRFGECGFVYIGDAEADLAVWEKAAKAVTVNPSRSLKARVDVLGCEVEHLTTHALSVRDYLKALRPNQWVKNALVFLPMLAAHNFAADTFGQSLLAFIAFSLVASSVYILNDLLDLAADRAHPRKRYRPFASGAVPIAHGTWLAPILLLMGLACALLLGWSFVLVILAYYAATTAYSLDLKHRVIIDICMLAGLYTMRIVAGGAATDIPLSVWLLAFSIFIFFSLATVKRYAELVDGVASGQIRAHGRGYHVVDLPLIGAMALASGYVSVLVMALYVNSPAVLALYSYPYVLWGICLVLLYWISRMVMVTHRGAMHDDPVVYATNDRISQVCLLLVLAFAAGAKVL